MITLNVRVYWYMDVNISKRGGGGGCITYFFIEGSVRNTGIDVVEVYLEAGVKVDPVPTHLHIGVQLTPPVHFRSISGEAAAQFVAHVCTELRVCAYVCVVMRGGHRAQCTTPTHQHCIQCIRKLT